MLVNLGRLERLPTFIDYIREIIKVDDKVSVNFHGSQLTLVRNGIVKNVPCSTGDSWIIEDIDEQLIHYISEGCTVSKKMVAGE